MKQIIFIFALLSSISSPAFALNPLIWECPIKVNDFNVDLGADSIRIQSIDGKLAIALYKQGKIYAAELVINQSPNLPGAMISTKYEGTKAALILFEPSQFNPSPLNPGGTIAKWFPVKSNFLVFANLSCILLDKK